MMEEDNDSGPYDNRKCLADTLDFMDILAAKYIEQEKTIRLMKKRLCALEEEVL